MIRSFRSVAVAALLSVAGLVAAQSAPVPASQPGEATARQLLSEYSNLLSLVSAMPDDGKGDEKASVERACLKAAAAYDLGTQTEALRTHLVATLDAKTLAEHDAFASSPELAEYNKAFMSMMSLLLSGDGLEQMLSNPEAMPSDEVMALGQSDRYKSLSELAFSEGVGEIVQKALKTAMPPGCEEFGPDERARDAKKQ